nr:hypothetical protein B0A51_12215 [Rachicladosporium sp. CCFEE 5018]
MSALRSRIIASSRGKLHIVPRLPLRSLQHRQLSNTAARQAGHAEESQYDPPGGWLFGVKPGEKPEKEGWENVWYYGFFGSLAFGVVGYWYKPDTSIQTWALEEARRRLEAEGILEDPQKKDGNVADCGPGNLETQNYYDNALCPDCRTKKAREYREYATGWREEPNRFRNKAQKVMAKQHATMSAKPQLAGATTGGLATTAADGPIVNFANARLADGTTEDLATTGAEGTRSSIANAIEQNNDPTPEQIATAVAAANAMMSESDEPAAGQRTASTKIITNDEDDDVPENEPDPGPVHPPVSVVDPKDTTLKPLPRYSPPAPPRPEDSADDIDDPNPWTPHGLSTRPGDEHDMSGYREWEARVKERNDRKTAQYLAEHRATIVHYL